MTARSGRGRSGTSARSSATSRPTRSSSQGSFDFPGTTMTELANRTVAAAQQLYGNAAANAVQKAFEDRGILS